MVLWPSGSPCSSESNSVVQDVKLVAVTLESKSSMSSSPVETDLASSEAGSKALLSSYGWLSREDSVDLISGWLRLLDRSSESLNIGREISDSLIRTDFVRGNEVC